MDINLKNTSTLVIQTAHFPTSNKQLIRRNIIFSADVNRILSEKRKARREWQQLKTQSKNDNPYKTVRSSICNITAKLFILTRDQEC